MRSHALAVGELLPLPGLHAQPRPGIVRDLVGVWCGQQRGRWGKGHALNPTHTFPHTVPKHTHARAHAHTYTHAHTCKHRCTYTCTHTHMHTHMHTHTCARPVLLPGAAASLAPVVAFAEGPLRAALLRVKDSMARAEGPQGTSTLAPAAASLVAAAARDGQGAQPQPLPQGPSAVGPTVAGGPAQGHSHAATSTTPAASAPPSPSPMASPAHASWGAAAGARADRAQPGSARPGRGGHAAAAMLHASLLPSLLRCSTGGPGPAVPPPALPAHLVRQQGQQGREVGTPSAEVGGAGGAAEVLRQELLALFDALPADAFRANNFWGSKARQVRAGAHPSVSVCECVCMRVCSCVQVCTYVRACEQVRGCLYGSVCALAIMLLVCAKPPGASRHHELHAHPLA